MSDLVGNHIVGFPMRQLILLTFFFITQNDLHSMEKEMYQAKRSRDQQLNETRKDVERRKESVDKAHDKRVCKIIVFGYMSCHTRKWVFRVSNQVQHKRVWAVTEEGHNLEILKTSSRGIVPV